MTPEEVQQGIEEGREALVKFAEMVVNGTRTRTEVYDLARVEADALMSLLDDAADLEAVRIHELLDRYETLIAALVH